MGRDVHKVIGFHFDRPISKRIRVATLQHDDPFVLAPIVPEAFGRGIAIRNDPFDAEVVPATSPRYSRWLVRSSAVMGIFAVDVRILMIRFGVMSTRESSKAHEWRLIWA
jgi:hypothetical protein